MSLVTIENNCGSAPVFDKEYIYYQGGGRNRNQLWRRVKDASQPAQLIDNHCGSTPAVDDNFVYFQGGPNKNQLHCKWKDGRGGSSLMSYYCAGSLILDGDYLYYRGGDSMSRLMRIAKDARVGDTTGAVMIDPLCTSDPVIDGDFIYFLADNFLIRRSKDGKGNRRVVNASCLSSPVIEGDYIYFSRGGNATIGNLYHHYKDGSQLKSTNMKIEGNCGVLQPILYGNYIIFQGGSNRRQLCCKRKDGRGAVIRLDDNCGSAPKIDQGYLYFLGSGTNHVLYQLPLPKYLLQ